MLYSLQIIQISQLKVHGCLIKNQMDHELCLITIKSTHKIAEVISEIY